MVLKFTRKQHEIGKIYSYFFESKDLKVWQAGQYLNITMSGVPPSVADRLFTIATAPHQEVIQITTVVGPSAYKQRLNQLRPGDLVEADQLGGDFIWQGDGRPKLFLAGGIGIPPYISMIRDNLHKNTPLNAALLYAGKADRRAFVDEVHQAARKDPTLRVVDYVDQRLSVEEIIKQIPDVKDRTIYLAGSKIS